MNNIFLSFPITNQEYLELDEKFGKLCYYCGHQLKKKNCNNNFTDDIEDISQELQMAIIQAGSYYKRQIYIERCLNEAKKHATDLFLKILLDELQSLWNNRTKHGANRQKFGVWQEKLLEKIVKKSVPKKIRPNKSDRLKIDSKFSTYCKAIVWNRQKNMGKKITQLKSIRGGLCSLSEFAHLAT